MVNPVPSHTNRNNNTIDTHPSHLCPLTLFGKLLPRLPPSPESSPLLLRSTFPRPPRRIPHSSHHWRRPSLRRPKTRSHQRRRSPPLSTLLHHSQQHRHPPRHRLRQRHHHPRLLNSLGAQTLPVPARLHAQPNLQYGVQRHLLPPLRLLRHRHRPHLQTCRALCLPTSAPHQQ